MLSRLKFSIAAYKTSKKIKADIIEGYNFISLWEQDWKRAIKALLFIQKYIRKNNNLNC